jgi:predicted dehydrogenase
MLFLADDRAVQHIPFFLSHPVRVALIGFGNAGRVFHAPLISGVPGLELACVVSSKPAEVLAEWPQVAVVAQPAQAFADPTIDLVVIATSNESHFPLAHAALLAGKHVLVDKPCTVTLAQTETLLALARERGLVFTVFQNRRFDADFLSLQQVIQSGVLGRIVHFESHFDRYRPAVPDRWRERALPGSGLWFDLGAHLVDQALVLFGMPQSIALDTACQRDGAQVNDYFHAQLRYGDQHPGLRVMLHASALVPALGPRFVVHGTLGSFVKYGLDVQEEALKAGGRPQWGALDGWGVDPQAATITTYPNGTLRAQAMPPATGHYCALYAALLAHLRGQQAAPEVTQAQLWCDMALLEAGEKSAALGVPVALVQEAPYPLD